MKPNFALSLSFEGISLLNRVNGGWHLLGEVALDSPDLFAEVQSLRIQAEAMEADFRCKIVLPNEQIKYVALETGRGRASARRAQAIATLEKETPYTAEQLAYDVFPAGDITYIAAVARETLAEAEAFAAEHHFNPVCFVAIPDPEDFPAEPLFGLTDAAATLMADKENLASDDAPITVISSGPLTLPADDPEDGPEPQSALTPDPVSAPERQPEPTVPEPPKTAPQTPGQGSTQSLAQATDTANPSETADKASSKSGSNTPAPIAPQPSAFSSTRARRSAIPKTAPALSGAHRTGADTGTASVSAPNTDTIAQDHVSRHSNAALRFDPATIAASLDPDTPSSVTPTKPAKSKASLLSGLSLKRTPKAKTPEAPKTTPKAAKPKPAKPTRARKVIEKEGASESQRLTIFGARDTDSIGGKPKFLGLVLTIVLMLFLAGVAAWATLFLEDGVASLFKRSPIQQTADVAPERQKQSVETGVLNPVSSTTITDSAEVEAMSDPTRPTEVTSYEAEARYAVTGIWERAPTQPQTPAAGSTDTLYLTSIDRVVVAQDAFALPVVDAGDADTALGPIPSPVAAGTTFALDARGFVVATAQGALTPDGVLVFSGKPEVVPSNLPKRAAAPIESMSADVIAKLANRRPRSRPSNLAEQNQRQVLGGRSLAELAKIRPRLRPTSEKTIAELNTDATAQAVKLSRKPRVRPENFAKIVARATPASVAASGQTSAPTTISLAPKIPTTASVARQATIKNAINLNKVNLIGVYGTSSSRRALVRLSSGRYKKVEVGDRIDGGKVAAIGESELRYVKRGQNVVIKLPKG